MDSDQTPQPPSTPDEGDQRPGAHIDLNRPCRITDVGFQGAKRTRSTLLAKMVTDLFAAKTLLECIEKSVEVKDSLKTLGLFSDISLDFEEAVDESIKVNFVVKEASRIKASIHTGVDRGPSHLTLEVKLPNLSGIGDSMSLQSRISKRFNAGQFQYSVPISPWRKLWAPVYSFICESINYDSQPSGYDQFDKGFINQISFLSMPQLKHSISFGNVWRHIKSSSIATPIEVRERCGHSVKSSLGHTITWDSRQGGNYPHSGIMASATNELAMSLVNGGAKFTRHEGALQLNASLLPSLLCQLSLSAGTLLMAHRINICDRFFAGGPLTLRGFNDRGLGPNVRGYALGASSYLLAGAHFYSILPFTTIESPINQYIRPHIFVNSGTIGELRDIWTVNSRDSLSRELTKFTDSLRYSCGLGFVFYFMHIRLEVNYCIPIRFRTDDCCSRGLQFGIGTSYT